MGGEFDTLSEELKTVISEVGFTEPTQIQQKAIPEILKGKNVLLISDRPRILLVSSGFSEQCETMT